MWPWSKGSKKSERRSGLEVPLWSNEPLCAYVIRLEPRSFRGVRLPKKLDRVDVIFDRHEDLLCTVGQEHGGGKFRAKCFMDADKKIYVGTYTFRISGDPLIDGRPIEPRD